MLLRFFRSIGTPMLFFIPFMGLFFWFHDLVKVPTVPFPFDVHPMPLFTFFTQWLPANAVGGSILALSLVVIQGFLLIRLNTRFILINNRTYLPALFFIVTTACIPEIQRMNPVIFSGFFMLLAIERMLESYHRHQLAYEVFNASLFVSVGALFYPFMSLMMLSIWISLSILRSFNWREWAFTIVGFLTPLFFAFSYFYLVYSQPWKVFESFRDAIFTQIPMHKPSLGSIIFIIFSLILLLISSRHMLRAYQSMKILPRKTFNIFLWIFLNVVMIYLLFPSAGSELIFLGAIPVSFLLSHYFTILRSNFWGNSFIFCMLAILVWIQFFQ